MSEFETTDESGPTDVRVTTVIDAPARAIYELLADPARHADFDGSGMVRAAEGTEPLTEEGQRFVMEMLWTDGEREYRVENFVTRLKPERALEWLVADYGQPPQGWRWGWTLDPQVDGSTAVTNYCDWGSITDPEVLAKKNFPVVGAEQVAATLRRLEQLVQQEPAGSVPAPEGR
ncbi:polyketide cyclase [Kocuria dechangensis]|uniref:Polyketide cyclase n=1 Tax=Kocuria dechangensis TaxID=1176249 RepID=A0A917H145_9MICC|nr:SRPBCC domain-containing protein [Kocuria dechangensis]GGG64212.1 polyketide cyclase [Kocuria dechangensis]